jgi:putative transport protein
MSGGTTWTHSGARSDVEYGDRVGILMLPDRKEEVRRHFGDTVKAAAEFSHVSLGLGMVRASCSADPHPIPGVGNAMLGTRWPLIVALSSAGSVWLMNFR